MRCLADLVIAHDVFRDQPVLVGRRVRLEPLTTAVIEDYLRALEDPEISRLTGSHATFTRDQIERWLATRQDHHDRADWAVMRREDAVFLGEVVLNELDAANESANYRIWLAGPHVFGRGYGTEATKLVVDYALDQVGLHRLGLAVFAFNSVARRVYEKCGFTLEGRLRDALLWNGERHDSLIMSVLRSDARPPIPEAQSTSDSVQDSQALG